LKKFRKIENTWMYSAERLNNRGKRQILSEFVSMSPWIPASSKLRAEIDGINPNEIILYLNKNCTDTYEKGKTAGRNINKLKWVFFCTLIISGWTIWMPIYLREGIGPSVTDQLDP